MTLISSMPARAPRPPRFRWELARYLTDGTHLYRFVGWVVRDRLVEFEDCRSLELLVVTAEDLERSQLTPVACAVA